MSKNIPLHDSPLAGVDWQEIHRRLEASCVALEKGNTNDGRAADEILRERAVMLAKPLSPLESELEQVEVLEFLLAGETYAIESSYIRETLPLIDFTPLFCTPSFVLGITNVRGRIVSIVDLRRFFDLPGEGLSDLNRLIIVRDDSMEFGLLADSIVGIRSLSLANLQPPLATLTGIRSDFLRGVTGERLALLDMGRILADKRLIVHEEVD